MSKDWDAVARELFREVVECDAPREAFVATFKAALETAYEQGRKDAFSLQPMTQEEYDACLRKATERFGWKKS
jgi:hypothetical protein